MTYPYVADCYESWDFGTVWIITRANRTNDYPWLRKVSPISEGSTIEGEPVIEGENSNTGSGCGCKSKDLRTSTKALLGDWLLLGLCLSTLLAGSALRKKI